MRGEKIDHVDGMTIKESDHTLATRLHQNTAKVNLNQHTEKSEQFGRLIVFGGHIISLARALSFNGLANTFALAAINGGAHVAPTFAGDTIYTWSEVLGKPEISGRNDLGALRLRTVASRDQSYAAFLGKGEDGKYAVSVVLDFNYTVLMPKLQN